MAPKGKAPKQQVPTHRVPSQLVWQLVKNYNCFLHKGVNGSQFSAEPGNLYNRNSYKYSGQSRLHLEYDRWHTHLVLYTNADPLMYVHTTLGYIRSP